MEKTLHIAVDFDGTIVEHKYPEIGAELPGAFDTLKALAEKGHKLILWTFRDGDELQAALDFCLDHGIIFWAVNNSYPEEQHSKYISRKIHADFFIDDRNFGGFPGWDTIRKDLLGEEQNTPETDNKKKRKRRFW